jgi:hypothetical protein
VGEWERGIEWGRETVGEERKEKRERMREGKRGHR